MLEIAFLRGHDFKISWGEYPWTRLVQNLGYPMAYFMAYPMAYPMEYPNFLFTF